jgi:glycosyltransferase involved in cell wall biosynthesis
MNSLAEADGVVVLDTGSGDGTVEKLRARGATVFEETISPWRFDVARNRAGGAGVQWPPYDILERYA